MIDRWANLIASAARDVEVQPRFVGILEEMTGRQAVCLERIAFNRHTEFDYPGAVFGDSFLNYPEYNIGERLTPRLRQILQGEEHIDETFAEIERVFRRPGVLLNYSAIRQQLGGELWEGYDVVADQGIESPADLSILESLGLVRHVPLKIVALDGSKPERFEVIIDYHHLTELGVGFCEVCSRPRVEELNEIDQRSRSEGRAADHDPFP
ncbi:hypothetical protein ACVIGB_002346 [Bradyrhizobium sp. USDA 4341]